MAGFQAQWLAGYSGRGLTVGVGVPHCPTSAIE